MAITPNFKGAEFFRVTLFADPTSPFDPETVPWPLGLDEAESDDRRPRERLRRRTLAMDDVVFEFICSAARMDFHFYAKPATVAVAEVATTLQVTSATVSLISTIEKTLSRLAEIASQFTSKQNLVRVAVSINMAFIFSTPEDAVAFMSNRHPNLGLVPGRDSDVIFQVNRIRKSVSDPSLSENQISTWRTEQAILGALTPTGPQIATGTPPVFGSCRLVIETNNIQSSTPLLPRTVAALLEELSRYAVRIALEPME